MPLGSEDRNGNGSDLDIKLSNWVGRFLLLIGDFSQVQTNYQGGGSENVLSPSLRPQNGLRLKFSFLNFETAGKNSPHLDSKQFTATTFRFQHFYLALFRPHLWPEEVNPRSGILHVYKGLAFNSISILIGRFLLAVRTFHKSPVVLRFK